MDVKQFSSDKILAHIDKIAEWLNSGVSKPITYELDMTNICDHKCPWCFGYYNRDDTSHLNLQEARDIICQISQFGGKGLTFTGGGEPLCNPVSIKVLEYAKQLNLDIGFITNGMLINNSIAEELIKNCTWVRISLDAATKEMFRFTHGLDGNAFERIVANIKLLIRVKKRLNSKCSVGVGYLTSQETAREIFKFALLCRDLKVDYAQFRPLLPRFGNSQIDYSLKAQGGIIKAIEETLKFSGNGYQVLYSKHKYDCMMNSETFRSYDACFGHHFATVICADKKMYICCHFRGVKKYCIGDLRKNSLEEIWHSKTRKKVYESINLKECIPLCRCNTFNTILWNIKQEKVHKNFI